MNKPAEVTLYKVFPREKGEVLSDPKKQQKWVRKLQETATKQNTEFVSYDADRGIWKFRVEHFSRCCSVAFEAITILLCMLPHSVVHATQFCCACYRLHLKPFIHIFY